MNVLQTALIWILKFTHSLLVTFTFCLTKKYVQNLCRQTLRDAPPNQNLGAQFFDGTRKFNRSLCAPPSSLIFNTDFVAVDDCCHNID